MKKLVVLFISLFVTGSVFAQSADVITEILNSKEMTYGQACYLCATYQKLIPDEGSYDDAIEALVNINQLPSVVDASEPIPLGNLAFLFAKIWNVKGGIFYRITKGSPRYAYKQLKADGIIDENKDPSSKISGIDALNIYTSCSFEYGKIELGI